MNGWDGGLGRVCFDQVWDLMHHYIFLGSELWSFVLGRLSLESC
jgi:hypothetical protein